MDQDGIFFFKRKCGNGWERLAGNAIISIFHRLKYGLHVSFLQREHGKKKWLNQTRTSRWPSGQENKPETDDEAMANLE